MTVELRNRQNSRARRCVISWDNKKVKEKHQKAAEKNIRKEKYGHEL